LISFLSQQTANLRSFEDFISCCTAGAEHVIADLVIFLFSTLRKKLRLELYMLRAGLRDISNGFIQCIKSIK